MKYRSEIDGLRAIAVLSVVVYHAFPKILPGGFIGVDIFFVLSGYLITQIIIREQVSQGFSYSNFYARRIKRILPAMWAVIAFSFIVALLLFSPEQFSSFFWSSISSAGFIANHYFSVSHGYFNNSANHSLLLHLWSLSVEEQFYIVWPFLLLIVVKLKYSESFKLVTLIAFALLSFLGAHLMASTGRFENYGFYLLPPRAGELLVGCILAIAERGGLKMKNSGYIDMLGLALIVTSLFLINRNQVFPGFVALLPCLGTAMLLSNLSQGSSSVYSLLTTKPMVYVGKISYSLYLWHWPLLVIPTYIFGWVSTQTLILMILLAFIFAHVSWRHLENPIRRSGLSLRKSIVFLYILPTIILVVVGGAHIAKTGKNVADLESVASIEYPPFCYRSGRSEDCKIGDFNQGSSVLMFGDSHAGHFRPYWDVVGKRVSVAIDAYAAQTCYPLISVAGVVPALDPSIYDKVNCIPHLKFIDEIADSYNTIILAASWTIYKIGERAPSNFDFSAQLEKQLLHWQASDKTVVLMAQVPWFKKNSVESYINIATIPNHQIRQWAEDVNSRRGFTNRKDVERYNAELRELAGRFENVHYLDAYAELRKQEPITPFYKDKILYANADHLSVPGAKYLAELVDENRIRNLLKMGTQ